MSDKRKPVAALHNGSRLIVVCDDGSVWTGALVGTAWEEREPIPGTRRAREKDDSPPESIPELN